VIWPAFVTVLLPAAKDSHAIVADGNDAGGGVDDRIVHAGEDAGAILARR